ncbi:MAG: type IV pilus modification protein PilV [Vicinamibacterales bacterium]
MRGFSMVEVLVALVVLSIGMLGIASMYVMSLRSGGTAIYRMNAVNLAADMADRIRANRNANLAYQGTATDSGCEQTSISATPGECDAVTMAANDLAMWNKAIAAALPSGATGAITVVQAGLLYTYQITIQWSDPESGTLLYVTSFKV